MIVVTAIMLALAACATPVTTLKHPKTGQVVKCGGNVSSSVAGGMVGYSIQESNDEACVKDYKKLGFKIVSEEAK
jgi:hypothetical protein